MHTCIFYGFILQRQTRIWWNTFTNKGTLCVKSVMKKIMKLTIARTHLEYLELQKNSWNTEKPLKINEQYFQYFYYIQKYIIYITNMNTLIFCFKILFYFLKLCHQLAKSTFSTVIILKNSYFPLCTWIFLSPYIYHWSKQTICIIEHISI
jgi:hypothetical protein